MVNKRQRKPEGKSRMDNQETPWAHKSHDEDKKKQKTQHNTDK